MISIVVCTFNGATRIFSCLSSLISQVWTVPFEILVVDNASSDDTTAEVQEYFRTEYPLGDWKVLQEPNPGLLNARLKGMSAAKYEWVLFCDDDNVLFPDFLAICQELLEGDRKLGVLGSHGIPEIQGKTPAWFEEYASSYALGPQLKSSNPKRHLDYVYGACSCYRKKSLLELFENGFSPVLSDRKGNQLISGGDVEWCALMQLLGYRIAYSPRLKFYHQIPASRLSWDYYLRLKEGISLGAGLLFPYHYFFENSVRFPIAFQLAYLRETIKAGLLYFKYRIKWKGNPSTLENQLAYRILETKFKSFRRNRSVSTQHYKQILKYFGS